MKEGLDMTDLKKQLNELELKKIELEDHEEQMKKKEKLMPWYLKKDFIPVQHLESEITYGLIFYYFIVM